MKLPGDDEADLAVDDPLVSPAATVSSSRACGCSRINGVFRSFVIDFI